MRESGVRRNHKCPQGNSTVMVSLSSIRSRLVRASERPDLPGTGYLASPGSGLPSVAHERPPGKQLAGREAVSTGDLSVHPRL